VLSWHVDYWDRLGWKDPFGSKAFTDRQRRLSKARGLKNIWTPMICVDGQPLRSWKKFGAAFEEARKKKAAWSAELSAKKGVTATIRLKGDAELPENAELIAVLFQEEATTKCTAGENEGKTLVEYFVVRAVSKSLDRKKARGEKGVAVKLAALEWRRGETVRVRKCPGTFGIAPGPAPTPVR